MKHIHNLEREKEKSKKALEAYKNKKPRKKLDIGSQTNVVYPEVPRKDFDAGTGENRSFKEALGVDGPRGVEGHKDIVSIAIASYNGLYSSSQLILIQNEV